MPDPSVSLQEYFERLLEQRDKALHAQLLSQQRALDKAEIALAERLAGMNEFRETLRDQAAQFITQKYLDTKLEALDTRLKALENKRADLEGRMVVIGVVVSAGVALALRYFGA